VSKRFFENFAIKLLLFLRLTQGGLDGVAGSPMDNGSECRTVAYPGVAPVGVVVTVGVIFMADGNIIVAVKVDEEADEEDDEMAVEDEEVEARVERSRSICALYWSNLLIVAGWNRVLDGRRWDAEVVEKDVSAA
jgi:hypothetical protein